MDFMGERSLNSYESATHGNGQVFGAPLQLREGGASYQNLPSVGRTIGVEKTSLSLSPLMNHLLIPVLAPCRSKTFGVVVTFLCSDECVRQTEVIG